MSPFSIAWILAALALARNARDPDQSQESCQRNEGLLSDRKGERLYFNTVKLIYSMGYGVSLASLSIAVLILLLFRRLHCARNYIHVQLFGTFILKAVAVFIKDAFLFSSEDTDHCTLSTALFLNSLLLSSFYHSRRCLWGLGLLGWGVPVLFIGLWIVSRVYFEDTEFVNFMLFLNIIRILMQKLNPRLIQFNNSSQYRRLTKSTLLLIPLFGSHYVVFNFLPDYTNVNLRLCMELCVGSFQVQKELQVRWLKWQETSYGVVSPGGHKGSQMDTPF
ncbi:hypothetical protein NHX12_032952 [Muraenolepis orangiensis]|uniref:G-protein coupled receptors family 2 profile 2 domain-containing protein n=1 Tax=Muraenolepis orangiensis TaxID=630683 RepID=A0A9Q0IHJ3_9TELE|nr:hypothetical protein NHX12_032952 [Muraenolepis orangiensis]